MDLDKYLPSSSVSGSVLPFDSGKKSVKVPANIETTEKITMVKSRFILACNEKSSSVKAIFYKSNFKIQNFPKWATYLRAECTEICGQFGEILKADGFSKLLL